MLLTLFKKDFKENTKYFLPVIMIIFAVGILTNFPNIIGYEFYISEDVNSVILQTTWILAIASFVCLFIFSGIAVFRSLYSNIYNEKGSELFTLPVSSSQIIVSKTLSVVVWIFIIFVSYSLILSFFGNVFSHESGYYYLDQLSHNFDFMISSAKHMFYFIFINVNKILYLIVISMIIIFAGALANSSFVQKYRMIIVFVSIVTLFIIVEYIEKSMFQVYSYDLFYSYFKIDMLINFDILYLTFFRLAFITLLYTGTRLFWEQKLQLSY